MEISEKVEYWRDIADYDIQTARSMQTAGRYLYTVFMCRQASEKLLKANYIRKFSKEAPFSHNLVYLNSLMALSTSDKQIKLMAELTTYYIEGRYPTYKKKLSALIDREKAGSILRETEALFEWLTSKLK